MTLADGGDQLAGGPLVAAEGLGPAVGRRPGPGDVGVAVPRVDAAARVGRHAAGERHAPRAAQQVDLEPAGFTVTVSPRQNTGTAVNVVVDQSPKSTALPGSTITLFVSAGS